jgi:hypothetical protein
MSFICSCRNKKEEPSSIYTLRKVRTITIQRAGLTSNSQKPRGQDVLILGRWLKAWPLLLLLDFKATDSCNLRWRFKSHSIRLGRCWQALGLPSEASDWDHKRTLRFLRVQQQKAAAFASGLHQKLGLHSTPGLASTVLTRRLAPSVVKGLARTVPGAVPRRCTPEFHRFPSRSPAIYPCPTLGFAPAGDSIYDESPDR